MTRPNMRERILAKMAEVSPEEKRMYKIAVETMRLLLHGEPVSPNSVAKATGLSPAETRDWIRDISGAELDAAGNLTGLGLTLNSTQHRFTVAGRVFFAWCALDTLSFPAVLGVEASIVSRCPGTGSTIEVDATPDSVKRVEPSTAVVSLVPLPSDSIAGVRDRFCRHVHYFASRQAASKWLAQHPEGEVVPVPEAFDLGRAIAAQVPA